MTAKPTIICIEDEEEMIDLISLILARHGYEVIGALGGRSGIEKVTELKPDLVLLDLMMPELDGWTVLQRMRADSELRTIPVVIVTAKASELDRVFGLEVARVEGYITKPFGPRDLVKCVQNALRSES
ncbi:MAG: response regulator [Chloroflexota bacterium]|jgi:DNA-binding response OmpR family regulator